MYIITTGDNVITNIDENIVEYNDYWLVGQGNQTIKVQKEYVLEEGIDKMSCYDVTSIWQDNIEPIKYCYTKKDGFYKNPNYIAPPQPIEEHLKDIEAALCELAEMIVGGE